MFLVPLHPIHKDQIANYLFPRSCLSFRSNGMKVQGPCYSSTVVVSLRARLASCSEALLPSLVGHQWMLSNAH